MTSLRITYTAIFLFNLAFVIWRVGTWWPLNAAGAGFIAGIWVAVEIVNCQDKRG